MLLVGCAEVIVSESAASPSDVSHFLSLREKRETVEYLERIRAEVLDGTVTELVMVVTRGDYSGAESAVFGTKVRDEYSLAGRLMMLAIRRLGFGFDAERL